MLYIKRKLCSNFYSNQPLWAALSTTKAMTNRAKVYVLPSLNVKDLDYIRKTMQLNSFQKHLKKKLKAISDSFRYQQKIGKVK